jgi:RimJ/RimL family protein N-acetyltransferase
MNFDFNQDYVLENETVLLRPLQMNDYEHLLPFSLHEADIFTYSLVKAIGAEALRTYLQNAIQARQERKEYAFIVWDKRAKSYAGSTRYYDFQPDHLCVQVGYTWYGKAFQGSGLNKNCKFLLFRFAFEQMGVERIELRADVNNRRSIEAIKSVGCQPEGILRSHLIKTDGTRRDSMVLSLLKSEWETGAKENLARKAGLLALIDGC